MNLLLDTHAFLWFITNDRRLSADTAEAIRDSSTEVYLSVASVWEIVIKYGLGKIPLPAQPETFLVEQRSAHGIRSLLIDEGAMAYLAALPRLHGDPFDRLLIAQSLQYRLQLVTNDQAIIAYGTPVLAP
jgi:PIN domain nuclease of toxin-antitoxin system